MKKWGYILLAVGVILFLLFYLLRRPAQETQEERVRMDSVTIAKHEMKAIQAERAALKEKIHTDSVERIGEAKAHDDRVAYLERQIRARSRQKATVSQLDSIRRVLYPGTEDTDSAYVMTLPQARECLQALEQAPFKDALIMELKGEVSELRLDNAQDRKNFWALDSTSRAELDKERIVSRNAEAMLADCQGKKKSVWRRIGNTLLDVGKVGLGFLAGRASK